MDKKEIVFVLASTTGGGAERVTINIANNLDLRRYNVHLIVFKQTGDFDAFIKKDIHVCSLNVNLQEINPINNFIKICKLAKILNKLAPDTIFSNGSDCNIITIIARAFSCPQSKLIIRETSLMLYFQKSKNNFILQSKGLWMVFCYKFLYRFASLLLAPCKAIVDDFQKTIGDKTPKVAVIPNFIDTQFIDSMLNRKDLESNSENEKDYPILISVGRLVKEKNLELGLKIFSKVLQKKTCYYWLVGKGPLENQLKQTAVDLEIDKHVRFFGFQKNPYPLMAQSQVFFLPSVVEGFPNTLLESMYSGLPSVITNFNSSVRDIITDGQEGYIHEKYDVEGMAQSLIAILSDKSLREKMSEAARKRIKFFTLEKTMIEFEKIL